MFDKLWILIVVFCALWRKNNPFRKCLKNESTWIFFVGCGEGPSLPDACPDLRARQQHRLQAAVPDTHRLRHPELPVRATQGSRLLPLNGHHAQVSQVFFCLPFCEKNHRFAMKANQWLLSGIERKLFSFVPSSNLNLSRTTKIHTRTLSGEPC